MTSLQTWQAAAETLLTAKPPSWIPPLVPEKGQPTRSERGDCAVATSSTKSMRVLKWTNERLQEERKKRFKVKHREETHNYEIMIRSLLMGFVLCAVYANSKPAQKKSRVYQEEPLSHLEHDDEKNYNYDHEAFLGHDDAKTFDQLPQEESKRRLGVIVDRIDGNTDGFVTEEELKVWIKKAQQRYIYESVEHQWKEYDTNNDGLISWEEYKNVSYGSYI
ncbi:hypothetical protein LDENG_00183300, partial [Lucifuga dentata]